MPTEMVT